VRGATAGNVSWCTASPRVPRVQLRGPRSSAVPSVGVAPVAVTAHHSACVRAGRAVYVRTVCSNRAARARAGSIAQRWYVAVALLGATSTLAPSRSACDSLSLRQSQLRRCRARVACARPYRAALQRGTSQSGDVAPSALCARCALARRAHGAAFHAPRSGELRAPAARVSPLKDALRQRRMDVAVHGSRSLRVGETRRFIQRRSVSMLTRKSLHLLGAPA
jgi:hypothetical protein